MNRLAFHYLAAFFVLTLYGGQVCPYVETLTLTQWGSQTLLLFTAAFALNAYIYKKQTASAPFTASAKVFKYSLAIFLASGLLISLYNFIRWGFPPASGAKLIVGWFLAGFFMSLDLTLVLQQKTIKMLAETEQHLEISLSYASLTKKFLFFAVFTSLSVLGVIYLVIIKDLDWLFSETPDPMSATISILKEFAFIFAAILSYAVVVAVSFTKNLKLYLNYQISALTEVAGGNLNASVPVSSADEFGHMAKYTNAMIKSLRERTEALQLTQDVSILSLASLAETRDNETGAHIMRTQRYVLALAESLKDHEGFKDVLTDENINLIYKSAPLHDIGKVGIPDSILLKPGKLTDEEFKIMRRHPNYGRKALNSAGRMLGKNSFLKFAEEIAFTHHEKWDGTGYPKKLKGEAIPAAGRIMALADVYDALISERVYKPAFTHEKAKEIILKDSGKHFDPNVVSAFVKIEKEFIRIAEEFSDDNYRKSAIVSQ